MSLILQAAFGRRHTSGAGIDLYGHSEGAAKCFESRFRLMVRVGAAQVVDVQRDLRVIDEALKKFMNEVNVEFSDASARKIDVELECWPTGQIHDHAAQCFIERYVSVAVAAHAFFVTYGFGKCLTERDTDVFHCVVRVNVEVAAGFNFEIEHGVPRNLVEHVIEKRDLRRQAGAARTVEVQPHIDLCLEGVAADLRVTPAHIGVVHAE
jgi:hypothetical protein